MGVLSKRRVPLLVKPSSAWEELETVLRSAARKTIVRWRNCEELP